MARHLQNLEALATSELRVDALAIAEAGYAAIDTGEAIRRKMRLEGDQLSIGTTTYSLADRRVYFVGVGKCAFDAAEAIEALLGDTLTAGIALDVASPKQRSIAKIATYVGTHPLPSEANVQATKRIMEFLPERGETDLVIMLISGGGSTLLCLPTATMTCADSPSTKSDLVLGEGILFGELTARGASIQDINTVRKHVSLARGGALAATAYPAEVVALIASDVPGNDIASIASGPTVLDTSTVADARAILVQYGVPETNLAFIETPKEMRYFEHVTNLLFITNDDALRAMQEEAVRRGYATEVVNDRFTGEARLVGHSIVEKLHDAPTHSAFLYAGESTVTITHDAGAGGRNQEMALAALPHIRTGELLLPFASDGHDNSDHAGAIADTETRAHSQEKNLSVSDFLDAHRSYDFFTTTADALTTGYTGSNVSDLIVALKK